MTFRHEVKLTENVTVVVIDGQDVSNPYTVTVTDVPLNCPKHLTYQ